MALFLGHNKCGIAQITGSLVKFVNGRSIFILLFFTLASLATTTLVAQPAHHYSISEFQIVGSEHYSHIELEATFNTKKGDTLDQPRLDADLRTLISQYVKIGYVFAKATIEQLQPVGRDSIKIRIRIHEGKLARLTECRVVGISESDTNIIRREFFIADSPVATNELLSNGASRLRHSGLFADVSEPTLYPLTDSTVGIELSLRETPSTVIDGVLGYNPAPTLLGKSYINGFLDLSFLNIGGTARQAAFRYQRLNPTSSQLQFQYLEPWIFSVPFDAAIELHRYDEDSLYVVTHLEAVFSLHSFSSSTLSAGAEYDIITPSALKVVNASTIASGTLRFVFDNRDDPIALQHGYRIILGASYGAKSITDSNNFQQTAPVRTLEADAEGAVSMGFARLVGVGLLSVKQVSSIALEQSDLFRIGGLTTLRGYREATFLVSQFAIGRLELRYMLASRSYFGLFFDAGVLERMPYRSLASAQWSAAGYGLTFLFETPIGYVQAAVALARGQNFDQAVLHFGLKTSL